MGIRLTIDPAGRLVIPKAIREKLRLEPGDSLELESQNEELTLRPVRSPAVIRKKKGVWVYHPEGPQKDSASDLIEQDREKRIRELMS